MLTLEVGTRNMKESPNTLRLRGMIPAVLYGRKEPSTPVVVHARKMASLWKEAGETTIISLTGIGEAKDSLIRDVQLHPVSGNLLHADFYVLEKGKKIEIEVPLVFVGAAPAEKSGHIIVKSLHEVEIEVLPAELPHELSIDISKLANVGDRIIASDIPLPPSATLITGSEEIVASVAEFKEEKVEAPVVPEGVPTTQEAGAEGAAGGAATLGGATPEKPTE